MELIWSKDARQDILEAHAYIAQDDPGVANRVVLRIQEAGERLTLYPEMGRSGRVKKPENW